MSTIPYLTLDNQFIFFFLSFNLLIGWQLSIWNYCKPFFSLPYNCQLLCFWRLAWSIVVKVFPQPFFLDIVPSRMFTTNSLCPIVCPIHEWCLFLKMFKSNLSSFALWKTSSFVILSVRFIFNILLRLHVSNTFTTLSSFFPMAHISDPLTATPQIQLFISFFFHFQTKVIRTQSLLFIIKHNFNFFNSLYYVFLFFPSSVNILRSYLKFGTGFRVSSSILILIFSGSLEHQ